MPSRPVQSAPGFHKLACIKCQTRIKIPLKEGQQRYRVACPACKTHFDWSSAPAPSAARQPPAHRMQAAHPPSRQPEMNVEKELQRLRAFESQLNSVELRAWTRSHVKAFLYKAELGEYAARFYDGGVDGFVLSTLTQENLADELGVKVYGHRMKIIALVQAQQSKEKSRKEKKQKKEKAAAAPVQMGQPPPAPHPYNPYPGQMPQYYAQPAYMVAPSAPAADEIL